MSDGTRGDGGTGQTTVYTTPLSGQYRLEVLHLTIATDGTAGVHTIRVRVIDVTLDQSIMTLDDLNEGAPSQTNTYTYGLGLNASACTLPDGLAVTDALPWTQLKPGSQIIVTPINGNGVEIPGDTIEAVTVFGTLLGGALDAPAPGPLLVASTV